MGIERKDVEDFLYREARLLDEHRYSEWGALWADDAIYWVPSNQDDYDPLLHISLIYDDREGIDSRIERLYSGALWSQDPPSRTRRLIGNIQIDEENGDEVMIYSILSLTELRRTDQRHYGGHINYKLRRDNGAFKMVMKKVCLVDNDVPLINLTFLL